MSGYRIIKRTSSISRSSYLKSTDPWPLEKTVVKYIVQKRYLGMFWRDLGPAYLTYEHASESILFDKYGQYSDDVVAEFT